MTKSLSSASIAGLPGSPLHTGHSHDTAGQAPPRPSQIPAHCILVTSYSSVVHVVYDGSFHSHLLGLVLRQCLPLLYVRKHVSFAAVLSGYDQLNGNIIWWKL